MVELAAGRLKNLVEGRIRRGPILRSHTHGWAEHARVEVMEVGEGSIRVQCNYPAYKVLGEGMEPPRWQKSSLEPAFSMAAQIVRLLFYEVSEAKFNTVRVDVYGTFWVSEFRRAERCILTTTASREQADAILWSSMDHVPERALSYFQTRYHRGRKGEIRSIQLDDELYRPEPPEVSAVKWQF